MDQPRILLQAIDRLYDAATDLDRWPAFLEIAAALFDARGSQIGHIDLVQRQLSFSVLYGYDWDEAHTRRYEALLPEDPRLPYFQSHPFKPVHCRMGVSEAELHASRVYREVLSVVGIEYSLGVNLIEERRSTTFFLVLRGRGQPPFTERDCEVMGELVPHLNRVVRLQRNLALLDFERRVALEGLDRVPTGIVIVDEDGRVRFANDAANDIARADDGLTLARGRIALSNAAEQGRLLLAVRGLIRSAREGRVRPGQAFGVSRPSGAEAFAVVVSTLWGNHLRFGLGVLNEPLAVIFVTDPGRAQETPVELLQRLYGLTPSQARLTERLVTGRSLKEAAADLGLTEGSARQYIKAIFDKTGTRRQADLVRKVMASPLWLRHQRRGHAASWRDLTAPLSSRPERLV